MTNNNDNNTDKSIANAFGEFAGGIKVSYQNYINNKAETERLLKEHYRASTARILYKFVCVEMAEVFSAAEKVIECIAKTQPEDIRLPFNSANFVDGEDTFDYKLSKAYNGDETPIEVITETINQLCWDRYMQGFSPVLVPLECEMKNDLGHYLVSVGNKTSPLPLIPLKSKGLGHHVGLFYYVQNSEYSYINSRKPQYLTFDRVFQLLDGGYWVNARLDYDGFITVSSGKRFPAKNLHGWYARIAETAL